MHDVLKAGKQDSEKPQQTHVDCTWSELHSFLLFVVLLLFGDLLPCNYRNIKTHRVGNKWTTEGSRRSVVYCPLWWSFVNKHREFGYVLRYNYRQLQRDMLLINDR